MMSVNQDGAARRIDDAADDVDQRGLAGAVRPQQREDFTTPDLQIDALERLKPGRIGLDDIRDRDGRLHGEGYREKSSTFPGRRAHIRVPAGDCTGRTRDNLSASIELMGTAQAIRSSIGTLLPIPPR